MDWDKFLSIAGNVLALGLSAWAAWTAARRAKSENRRDEAQASEQLTQAALALVEPLEKRIGQLEQENQKAITEKAALQAKISLLQDEMREVRFTNAQLLAGVNRLSHQVRALGHEPVFDPQRDLQILPAPAPRADGEKTA